MKLFQPKWNYQYISSSSDDLESFWERKDALFADDFALLKSLRSNGLNEAPYFHCFLEDDPSDLCGIDVETQLPVSCYDRFFILQSSPRLIHLAAYFNASLCFSYLSEHGADINSTDSFQRTVDLYAVAGSSYKIFSLLNDTNIFKCMLIASNEPHKISFFFLNSFFLYVIHNTKKNMIFWNSINRSNLGYRRVFDCFSWHTRVGWNGYIEFCDEIEWSLKPLDKHKPK